jgi:hypothetical protein
MYPSYMEDTGSFKDTPWILQGYSIKPSTEPAFERTISNGGRDQGHAGFAAMERICCGTNSGVGDSSIQGSLNCNIETNRNRTMTG